MTTTLVINRGIIGNIGNWALQLGIFLYTIPEPLFVGRFYQRPAFYCTINNSNTDYQTLQYYYNKMYIYIAASFTAL